VADQHAVLDRERGQQPGQHEVGLDLHVGEARIGRPWARPAVGGAVVDHAVALQTSQSFCGKSRHISMQPSPSCRKTSVVRFEPVAALRREAADAQGAVAEIDEGVGHASDVTGTGRREKKPIAAGSTVRNRIGASSMPPTTTTASGRCTWLPIAVENAAGQQADAGRDAGHQHRPHLLGAGRAQRLLAREAGVDQPVEGADHHDAVHGGDAEQRDEADRGGDAERHVGQGEPQDAADQRHRDRAGGQQRVGEVAEADIEQQQDQRDRHRHGDRQAVDRGLEVGEVARPLQAIAGRQPDVLGDALLGLEHGAAEIAAAHRELDRDVALLLLAIDVEGAARQADRGDLAQRHLDDRRRWDPARRSRCASAPPCRGGIAGRA
jgi:hypothetical protein